VNAWQWKSVLLRLHPVTKKPAGHVTPCVHATHDASVLVVPGHCPSGMYDTPAWHVPGPLHATQPASTTSVRVVPSHAWLFPWYQPLEQLTAHAVHCRSALSVHCAVW